MWFLVLGLFALGCAAASEPRRGPWVFQLDRDSPLWDAAVQAAADWTKATGLDVRVATDGDIPIIVVDHLTDQPPDSTANGHSWKGAQARIEVLASLESKGWRAVLTHEMGHHLRGDGAHLEEFGNMMSASEWWYQELTPADVAFICDVCECKAA